MPVNFLWKTDPAGQHGKLGKHFRKKVGTSKSFRVFWLRFYVFFSLRDSARGTRMDLIYKSTLSRSRRRDDNVVGDEPQWDQSRLISIDERTLHEAEAQIVSCEFCTPDQAEILFDDILDRLTGNDPQSTDYLLNVPARCPRCQNVVRTGSWNWVMSPDGEREASIVPGTLVAITDK
jgi:hypothetical protein